VHSRTRYQLCETLCRRSGQDGIRSSIVAGNVVPRYRQHPWMGFCFSQPRSPGTEAEMLSGCSGSVRPFGLVAGRMKQST
jgi:hypothetical protein